MKKSVLLMLCLGCTVVNAQDNINNGHQVWDLWCAPCHAPGPKHPGTQALDALYQGSRPAALEERTDLTAEFIATFVRGGVSIMAPFRKTEISDDDLQDLVNYLTATSE